MKVSGEFSCRVFEHNTLIQEFKGRNQIVEVGKSRMASALIQAVPLQIDHIGFGEGTTDPDPSDEHLSGNVYTKPLVIREYISPATVKFSWVLGNSEANGLTISEFGLFNTAWQMFARKTGLTVAKNNTITLTGDWTITIH
jgi:hypothetical protein